MNNPMPNERQLIQISDEYHAIFDERLDRGRLAEIYGLIEECESLNDVEALADCDDATISFGEFHAISHVLSSIGWEYVR